MNGWCDAQMSGILGCKLPPIPEHCPECDGEFCMIHSVRCDFCANRVCQQCIDDHEELCRYRQKKGMGTEGQDQRRKQA